MGKKIQRELMAYVNEREETTQPLTTTLAAFAHTLPNRKTVRTPPSKTFDSDIFDIINEPMYVAVYAGLYGFDEIQSETGRAGHRGRKREFCLMNCMSA